MELERSFLALMEKYVHDENHLILGVSGGLDSMVLLHLVARCRDLKLLRATQVSVVHVNHHLREQAHADERFVAATCETLQMPCQVVHVQVGVQGSGLEAAARDARYQAFDDVAKQFTSPILLLAHHQSDQVETFLQRWLRGSGLHGLGGMRRFSVRQTYSILRPLLDVRKVDLASYAEDNGVAHCEDETNFDQHYTRNYLRHSVIPQLARVQQDLEQVTGRLTESLQVDDDFLEFEAKRHLPSVVVERSLEQVCLNTEALIGFHLSLQRRMIHILLRCFTPVGWTYVHINQVLQLISESTSPSASMQLANGIFVRRSYGYLYIGKNQGKPGRTDERASGFDWSLGERSRLRVGENGDWQFWCLPINDVFAAQQSYRGLWRLYLPYVQEIGVQTSCPTSRKIRPLGLGGSKKLQDVYTDKKVPREFRKSWPVFTIDGEVVWLPGLVRSEPYKVHGHDARGWVILSHLKGNSNRELGTFYRETRRIIRE